MSVLHVVLFTSLLVGQMEPAQPEAAATVKTSRPTQNNRREIGEWLVHLARHNGHLIGRSDPRKASLHVIALLEAAAECAPDTAEAYYWLYDLYQRMGKSEAAMKSLARYVELEPSDDGARLKLLEFTLAERQTAEARVEFVKQELERSGLTRIYESQLRGWLAKFHRERDENEEAGKQVEHALRLNPMNVAARQLAYEMYGETQAELQRVELALQMIAINPSQVNLVWDLAEFLDRLSLHKQAQEWYCRAIDMHKRAEAGPIPADLWQKLAISYLSSGDAAKAKEAAEAALKEDDSLHSARLLHAGACRKLGEESTAAEDTERVRKAYEKLAGDVIEKSLADEAIPVAWYYCYHEPNKEQAIKLAEIAMKTRTPSPLAKLAYGYALSANGRTDEAIKVLKPLAADDQLAAVELARCLFQRSEKSEAITLLHKASSIQYSGLAYDQIKELLEKHGEKPGSPPMHEKICATLDKFQRDVFDYYRRTSDFLKFTVRFLDDPITPTGPVNVAVRLENVGPFIITFGDGFMARPLVALSAKVSGAKAVEYRDYLQVLLSARPVLVPGDAMEKIVAVDVGPMREQFIASITTDTTIEFTAMFDPIYHEGKLAPGLGTVTFGPIAATRKAVDDSSAAIAALADLAAGPDATARARAAELAGAILASRLSGSSDESSSEDVSKLRSILARLATDSDWTIRARTLVAAGWSKLDAILTQAASATVRDGEPAVRVLAVQLFAVQQGEAFRKVLEHVSRSDASQSVRTMATSYLIDGGRTQANSEMIEP